ncbi:MAG: flavodoxin-dependent (E)-4-hydroxy-3-methylbut-2-enyl-diphosphate synthase, partial [Candidatus Omnitrophota bacterium]
FETLAREVKTYVIKKQNIWQKRYPEINTLKIAIMGCIVNGPGESKHANVGLSLPGRGETNKAIVYTDGKLIQTLKSTNLKKEFIQIIERYIKSKYR